MGLCTQRRAFSVYLRTARCYLPERSTYPCQWTHWLGKECASECSSRRYVAHQLTIDTVTNFTYRNALYIGARYFEQEWTSSRILRAKSLFVCTNDLGLNCGLLTLIFTGLEHATIRDNIIFGSALGFDESRYQAVVEACALNRDLEIFDAGDMTGEIA